MLTPGSEWTLPLFRLKKCHLSFKKDHFPDNLPRCQALSAHWFSHIIWILRKFADSGKKHFRWKRADVLRKPNSFFDLLSSVARISKLA
jgi:hypothetical protein